MSSDGSKQTAVIQDGGIYTSIDSGSTWIQTSAPQSNWNSIAISSDGSKQTSLIRFEGIPGIYTSSDYGSTWTLNTSAPSTNWISVAMSSDGSKQTAINLGRGIYTSSDYGSTWTLNTSAPSLVTWISVAISSDGSKQTAVILGGGIYTSSDSGLTWTLNNSAPSTDWLSIAMSSDGSKQTAVILGGGIYTSSDSGSTWTINISAPDSNWTSVAMSSNGSKQTAVVQGGAIYNLNIPDPPDPPIPPNPPIPCFNKGTKILCQNIKHSDSDIYIPIEDITLNTFVKTYKNDYIKVKNIINGSFINDPDKFYKCMYKMKKTDNMIDDLIVTGRHSILLDHITNSEIRKQLFYGGLISKIENKYLLIAAASNKFEQIKDKKEYTYYHLILENENEKKRYGIWSNGILTESMETHENL
jgi:hypothetical protein